MHNMQKHQRNKWLKIKQGPTKFRVIFRGFLSPKNASKNSIFNWIWKLNLDHEFKYSKNFQVTIKKLTEYVRNKFISMLVVYCGKYLIQLQFLTTM